MVSTVRAAAGAVGGVQVCDVLEGQTADHRRVVDRLQVDGRRRGAAFELDHQQPPVRPDRENIEAVLHRTTGGALPAIELGGDHLDTCAEDLRIGQQPLLQMGALLQIQLSQCRALDRMRHWTVHPHQDLVVHAEPLPRPQ